jgi:hypothetical protein
MTTRLHVCRFAPLDGQGPAFKCRAGNRDGEEEAERGGGEWSVERPARVHSGPSAPESRAMIVAGTMSPLTPRRSASM